jgi:hypothetical protein
VLAICTAWLPDGNEKRRAAIRTIAETICDRLMADLGFDETEWVAQAIGERARRTREELKLQARRAQRAQTEKEKEE